ncbi:MAG: glycosyltransferase family 87 protein, partial [Planctomycetota bacterium]
MNEASPRSWISSLSSGQRAALLAALFTLIALGVLAFLAKGTSELPVYTRAAERMALGQEIYRPAEPKPFTYPPFLALPFVPLTLLPGSAHRPLWFLVNLGALVWILRLLARRLRPIFTREPRAKRAWLFGLLVFLLAARHVLSVFENQSNDLLVFLAVALAVDSACRARHLETGIWAGVGTALKATPVLFGPVLLWQRRFAAAAVLGLVTLALTLSPDWILPRSEGGSWVVSWYESFLGGIRPGEPASAAGAWAPWNKLNQNLASTIYRLTTAVSSSGRHLFDVSILNLDASTRRWLTLAAQLAILGLLLRVTRPSLTRDLPSEELSLRRLGEGSAILTSMVLL